MVELFLCISFAPLLVFNRSKFGKRPSDFGLFQILRFGITDCTVALSSSIFPGMGESESSIPACDEEQHVIVAAHHVVKALVASRNLSTDLRKILADLDSQLSKMTKLSGNEAGETKGVEDRLNSARVTVLSWQSNRAMIWDSAPQEASEYLQAVDEVRRLTESLGTLLSNKSGKDKELLNQAQSVLHIAMARLEEELIYILSQNMQPFESENTSFHSCEESSVYAESVVSTEDDSIEEASRRVSCGTESQEYSTDLVHPDVISDIKCIANLMFASNYDQEFCEAFLSFWKDTLDEYLRNLGIEKLSIEKVMKMDWRDLARRIRKWCRAIKIVIRFFLTGEKRLFDQVLGEFGYATSTCFLEASKASILCLLNFGQAIAIGPREPERLPYLIDMYEALANLIPDIDALFAEEVGSFLRVEFSELLSILGVSVKATFLAFGDRVASNPSLTPFPNGGVHHLTKYVMNYIKLLAEYGDTLNLILDQDWEPFDHQGVKVEVGQSSPTFMCCPMASQLRSVTSMLERNLDCKSHLYKDVCLKHIFMMNNIHYMVQKVKYSDLRTYFGDQWIRIHNAKFQKHATIYERATWGSILSLLRDDGVTGKAILKERCRGFSIAFEEVYKSQTGWSVPDPQLRDDLRISTSQTVINAYRPFVKRVSSCICDRYIKYSDTDLENFILDLFEGKPRSLSRRR